MEAALGHMSIGLVVELSGREPNHELKRKKPSFRRWEPKSYGIGQTMKHQNEVIISPLKSSKTHN